MICKNCGQEIPDSELLPMVCPSCKTPVEPTEEVSSNEEGSDGEDSSEGGSVEADGNSVEEASAEIAEEALQPEPTGENTDETESSLLEEEGDSLLEADGGSPQEMNLDAAAKKNNTKLILLVTAIAVVVIAVIVFALSGNQADQAVTADAHYNPTSLRYSSENAIGLVRNGVTAPLYENTATDLASHASISQMFSSATPYVGDKNYVELANGEVLYVTVAFEGVDASGQPINTGKLYLKKPGAEAAVLDDNAQAFYASNGTCAYFMKVVDGKSVQSCYKDGKVTLTDEITGTPNSIITKISDDSSLSSLVVLDEAKGTNQSGYIKDGTLVMLPEGTMIYDITNDGKQVYALVQDAATSLTTLFRVKDLATGELQQLGDKITDAVVYEDDGSLAFIGDVNVESGKQNPVGSLYYYDSVKGGDALHMADYATAILESYPRQYGWMNENGGDLQPTELVGATNVEKHLFKGQLHYLDSDGSLKAIALGATPGDSGLDGFTIAKGLYDSEGYTIKPTIFLLTHSQDYIYWSSGADVYRYKLGSMSAPQVCPLDEEISAKINAAAQMGYIITGSGDIIEESGGKTLLRVFDQDGVTTILENMGATTIVGLDNDGKNLYFLSEDKSLYSKSVESKSNPKLIASDVHTATATTDGIYLLQNFSDATGGVLGFLPYGAKTPTVVSEKVMNISPTPVLK